ncbi:hypothetical protein AgCh_024284 [Apium graveolens]
MNKTSNDESRSQTPVASASQQRNNELQEQVILELEEDEFHTLDELAELDQSKAYLARKFSNIRVKKPRFFKGKGQSFNKGSSWKGKGKYTSDSKNGYKTGSVDRSKIRCFNCDELGHFPTECRKPKKAKKYKAYLELEANRLTKINEKLENEKQEIELLRVEFEAVKQENAYLKKKLKCANEIEAVLREKLEKNEVKLKSFKNASELVGQYHEKNKPCVNIAIGLDYDALKSKKKDTGDKGKATKNENIPTMLKKVISPMFKACEVNFSEEELIINQEIVDANNEKKNAEATQSSKAEENLMDNQGSKTPVKETKTEYARKKKKNRNGKIWINKSNNFSYVADAPRKKCEKCGSMNHLTHLCKKVVSKPVERACKYNEADANDPYSFCDKFDCIPYNLKLMKSYHKLRVDLKETKIGSTTDRENAQQSINSILSEITHSTSAKSVNKKKVPTLLGLLNILKTHCVQGKMKKVI